VASSTGSGAERIRGLRITRMSTITQLHHKPSFVICRDCGTCGSSRMRDGRDRTAAAGGGFSSSWYSLEFTAAARPAWRRRRATVLKPMQRTIAMQGRGSLGWLAGASGPGGAALAIVGSHLALTSVIDVMSAHITFRDLTLGYDGHPAVHHLNGVVEAGSLTASWAEGSGKSTLRRGSWGMLRPLGGEIMRTASRRARSPTCRS
jgi:ABC-type multidrug transport system fused ATPase/permease subunit